MQNDTLTIDTESNPIKDKPNPSLVEDLIEAKMDRPKTKIQVRAVLLEEHKMEMTYILTEYKEIFACKPSDMRTINIGIISQNKKIDPII